MRRISKLPNGKFVKWSTVSDGFFDTQYTFTEMVNSLAIEEQYTDDAVEFLMNSANWEPFEENAAFMWHQNDISQQEMREWLIKRGCDDTMLSRIESMKKEIDSETQEEKE